MNQRQHRIDLYKQDPHCFWCGVLTVQPVMPLSPNSATLDHLYSTAHPFRSKKARQRARFERNTLLYVLACGKCNKERGYKENEGKVFIPKLDHRIQIAANVSLNGDGASGVYEAMKRGSNGR